MNFDFFADEPDKLTLLELIFNETALKIFELSSPFGQLVQEYKNVSDVISKFDLKNENAGPIHFQLWSPDFKAEPLFRRVELNPKYCQGHTFRYVTDGWGLIQLYLGGIKNNQLKHSHIGHFEQKSALIWEVSNHDKGKVDDWDWAEIQKASRKLKSLLNTRLVINKVNTFSICKGAHLLQQQGTELVY